MARQIFREDGKMKREIVEVPGTKKVAHLSRAVRFGDMVFVAGMVGTDPATGKLAGEDIASQARQTMDNIKAALEAAGASMDDVLKMTCYLAKFDDKNGFNEVYVSYFKQDPPARACFAVGDLGPGVLLEIETIAGIQN
jgi:2-iminobutanoate/2-iminopropanoate deaminase